MRRLLVLTALAAALTAGAQQRIVRLWNNASAPHDNGLRGGERVEEDRLFNTTEAVLYVYAADPARATGQAAVVCPGGGYRFLSIGGDGHAVGRWLAEHGVTAAVHWEGITSLKQRLKSSFQPAKLPSVPRYAR